MGRSTTQSGLGTKHDRMSSNRIHTFLSTIWIGGHDTAGNKAWVTLNKRISGPRRRRTNAQTKASSTETASLPCRPSTSTWPKPRPDTTMRSSQESSTKETSSLSGPPGQSHGASWSQNGRVHSSSRRRHPQRVQASNGLQRRLKALLEH
jgi:hypothetical protein